MELPSEKLEQFDRASLEADYDVQALQEEYDSFAQEVISYSDDELHVLEVIIARQLSSRRSLMAYVLQEKRRRAMWEKARRDE